MARSYGAPHVAASTAMNDRKLVFVCSPEAEELAYPADCPFKTQRVGLTRHRLKSFGLLGTEGRSERLARPASILEMQQAHSPRYLR